MTPEAILFMMGLHIMFYGFGLLNGIMIIKTKYRKIIKRKANEELK